MRPAPRVVRPLRRVLSVVALALATGGGVRAQGASESYDVLYVETRAKKLELPTVEAYVLGRLAVAATSAPPTEPAEAVNALGDRVRVTLRRDASGVARFTFEFVVRDDVTRVDGALDREITVSPIDAHWSSRTKSYVSGGLVVLAADGPPLAASLDAAGVLRLLVARLDAAKKPPTALGTLLGTAPLAALLGPEETALRSAAWGPRVAATADSELHRSPFLPPLLAFADAAAVDRVARHREAEPKDAAFETAEAHGPGAVFIVRSDMLREVVERPLTIAYLQAKDPVVRGAAGWLLYESNPGRYFGPLAAEVAAGAAVLPGSASERAEREAAFVRGAKYRDASSGALGAAIGLAATGLLLFVLRRGLTRALFK